MRRDSFLKVQSTGQALEKFKTFIGNQGGDASIVDHPEQLPRARYQIHFQAQKDGMITEMIANEIGVASMMLGAGRQTKEDVIDLGVGIVLNKRSATVLLKVIVFLLFIVIKKMLMKY